MKTFFLIVGGLGLIFAACAKKKVPETAAELGLDYYPTTSGKYVIYEVDSIVYNDLPVDTIEYKYQIKEKLADSFTDNLGQPAIRLERYIKRFDPNLSYDSMPWSVKEVWLVNASQKSIQVQESNIRYTKLIFPVTANATWNGNAFNTLGDWEYTYSGVDQAVNINGNALQKVATVTQKDFRTLISYQGYFEKYARGIGLVERLITDIASDTIVPSIPIDNRIQSGVIYKQTLVTYGYE